MAAPAGGGGSAVSVLAPNGRRHTVKVTPSTVLLQVLEDTCRCQDFNPNEYDLKFQRSVLDLSLQWRFANLPNNAKLEMVPVSRSREGPQNTGGRDPSTRASPAAGLAGARSQPCGCGRRGLSLPPAAAAVLTGLRGHVLVFEEAQLVRIAVQLEDGARLQGAFCSGQTLWELLSHFPQTRECLQQPGEATPVCVSMRDEVTGAAALRSTTLQSLGLTGGSATIRFVMKRVDAEGGPQTGAARSKTPASPADQVAGGPLPPLNSEELSCGDLSRQGEAGTSGAWHTDGPKPADAPAKQSVQEPGPARFVPFSGGGQRLGGPSGSGRSLTSPSAKLPTSASSPGGPSKPKKSKPGEEPPQEPEPPVDRDAVVCHPDLEDLLQAWPAELPDEFFEVTVDDVRRRLAQLKSERQRLEEAPLVTKAFREARMKEKLERYPKVAVRVLFPDRYVLQGFFRPSETVITPPKTVLDDHTLTLFQANLFPAALVHLGAQEPAGLYLAPRLLEHTVPPSAADMLVARCMSRAAGSPPPLPAPELPPAPEEGAPGPPEPAPGTAQPVRRSLGKVPTWLKLPAGKR
ncbi:tether containing UBX domain for GLUT4 isoform X2 [Oryctolagus cuniculus]|uniref:tether containing UBX domain for GLUT4 isoform X2 n=1 Tax=Oryctolagus cuniculus TaxID=9986 RepID=UPI00387A7E12